MNNEIIDNIINISILAGTLINKNIISDDDFKSKDGLEGTIIKIANEMEERSKYDNCFDINKFAYDKLLIASGRKKTFNIKRFLEFHNILNCILIINCKTEEEAIDLFRIFSDNNIKWHSSSIIDKQNTYWQSHKENTCYCIENGCISYGALVYFKHCEYYHYSKILSYSDILFV